MKPKLFFTIPSLLEGGAERVVTTLANHFNRLGFRIIIISFNQGKPAYHISEGIKLVYLTNRNNKYGFFFRVFYAGLTFFKLMYHLIREKPDCVISFITSANLWTGLTCSLMRIPYIVSERTTPDRTINQFNNLMKWLSFVLYSKSKAIVVSARGVESCLKKNKSFRKLTNFNVIKNSVNRFLPPSPQQVHFRKFILGVGRLTYVKGFDQLIDAYSKVQYSGTDLIIAGEGGERERLTKQIQTLGLTGQVHLIGSKNNLQDYYKQAEIFVLPSRNEGYPNALIEAMSMGCPSIAMDCEFGPSEIIENGMNGILVENRNIRMLTEAIISVLENPALKANLAKNALLVNETNSQVAISAQWEELIRSNI